MIRTKQLHQRLENELARAEKMAAHAAMFGAKFDDSAFRRAEEDLMFCEFHDILPGSCIQSAEEDAIVQLSHGIAEAEKIQLKAFSHCRAGSPRRKAENIRSSSTTRILSRCGATSNANSCSPTRIGAKKSFTT